MNENSVNGNKTFVLAMTAIVLSFVGVWQNMFEADVFVQILQWALGVYGIKTIGGKGISAWQNKQTPETKEG